MDHDRIKRMLEAKDERSDEDSPGDPVSDGGDIDTRDFDRSFREFLDRYEDKLEELDRARREYERGSGRRFSSDELLDLSIRALEELRVREREIEPRKSGEYERTIEESLDDLRDLQNDYEDFLEEYQHIFTRLESRNEELRDELEENNSGRIGDIRDFQDYLTGSARDRFLAGLGLIGGGLYSAGAYPFESGIIDFYANAPDAYASHPEMIFLTLGLPAAGIYSFKKAYDAVSDYRRLESKEERLRSRDFDDL